jgi:hypothetical protein
LLRIEAELGPRGRRLVARSAGVETLDDVEADLAEMEL